eukprot:gnl/MRDRNA2_/MRDRNA2_95954_c0_seq1.p1 gnl/MRDRNA2_/MRDRNA2_95954_c0~~gnl/MRDRNA2_/MRDRNA2_95954_c0_seq1.p1  ORF type:complete len:959 (+),score=213.34 gnl/MRDRNA2_/MRDRNA2_95954_c0_seq1:102-2978(+)
MNSAQDDPNVAASEGATQESSEEQAAIKIQSSWRGKKARRDVAARRGGIARVNTAPVARKDSPEDTGSRATADAKESSNTAPLAPKDSPEDAGCRATDNTEESAEETKAALKIQSSWRGKKARKDVAARRAGIVHANTAPLAPENPPEETGCSATDDAEEASEEAQAALKIQSQWRGNKARRDVAARRGGIVHASTAPVLATDDAQGSQEEHQAAVQIQSRWRGKKARKDMTQRRAGILQTDAQQVPQAEASEEEQVQAATKIQANWRGKQSRRAGICEGGMDQEQIEQLREIRHSMTEAQIEETAAATKIQAKWRDKQDFKKKKSDATKKPAKAKVMDDYHVSVRVKKDAATFIQKIWRGFSARNTYGSGSLQMVFREARKVRDDPYRKMIMSRRSQLMSAFKDVRVATLKVKKAAKFVAKRRIGGMDSNTEDQYVKNMMEKHRGKVKKLTIEYQEFLEHADIQTMINEGSKIHETWVNLDGADSAGALLLQAYVTDKDSEFDFDNEAEEGFRLWLEHLYASPQAKVHLVLGNFVETQESIRLRRMKVDTHELPDEFEEHCRKLLHYYASKVQALWRSRKLRSMMNKWWSIKAELIEKQQTLSTNLNTQQIEIDEASPTAGAMSHEGIETPAAAHRRLSQSVGMGLEDALPPAVEDNAQESTSMPSQDPFSLQTERVRRLERLGDAEPQQPRSQVSAQRDDLRWWLLEHAGDPVSLQKALDEYAEWLCQKALDQFRSRLPRGAGQPTPRMHKLVEEHSEMISRLIRPSPGAEVDLSQLSLRLSVLHDELIAQLMEVAESDVFQMRAAMGSHGRSERFRDFVHNTQFQEERRMDMFLAAAVKHPKKPLTVKSALVSNLRNAVLHARSPALDRVSPGHLTPMSTARVQSLNFATPAATFGYQWVTATRKPSSRNHTPRSDWPRSPAGTRPPSRAVQSERGSRPHSRVQFSERRPMSSLN